MLYSDFIDKILNSEQNMPQSQAVVHVRQRRVNNIDWLRLLSQWLRFFAGVFTACNDVSNWLAKVCIGAQDSSGHDVKRTA